MTLPRRTNQELGYNIFLYFLRKLDSTHWGCRGFADDGDDAKFHADNRYDMCAFGDFGLFFMWVVKIIKKEWYQ